MLKASLGSAPKKPKENKSCAPISPTRRERKTQGRFKRAAKGNPRRSGAGR
jgi:hypothetical protein